MKIEMTSRERVMQTLARKPTDHVPMAVTGLCHGSARFLSQGYNGFRDPFAEADHLLSLGLDTAVMLYSRQMLSERCHAVQYRVETVAGGTEPVWVKEYATPAGKLRQAVRKNGYRHDEIHLFSDDHVPPGRSVKYLIDREEELAALRCLLKAPERRELDGAYGFAAEARQFCDRKGILLTAPLWGIGDPLMWLSGVEGTLFAAMDQPDFLHEYIQILSDWNMAWLTIYLEMGADMVLRRGWYECADFWSPALYRDFLSEPLRREVNMAHEAGAKYAYVMNSGVTPLTEEILRTGVDMLTNAEPEKCDLAKIKRAANDRVALCTGVNNYHVLEDGTEEDVETAVGWAMETLAPGGGFVLAPSDSVNYAGPFDRERTDRVARNFHKMMDVWKQLA